MTDEDAAPTQLRFASVRSILDGDVPNETHILVHGTLKDVTVKTHEQAGRWARGRLVDGDGSIDFWMFARAFARTGRLCVETDGPIAATACVSVPPYRTALVVNSIERIEPGVDQPAV